MRLTGFNLADYERVLAAAIDGGYAFYGVRDYIETDTPREPYVVLRHDVDRKVENAAAMASVEAEKAIEATYYFRTSTFDPATAREIEDRGHEIGYHYEDLAKVRGDVEAAHHRFADNLASFREHVDVTTACAHGSPLSPHRNTDMWKDARTPDDYDLVGEAYRSLQFDSDGGSGMVYFSDTGRDWTSNVPGFGDVRSTADVVEVLETRSCSELYVLAHPSRWSNSSMETVERAGWDVAAETAKTVSRGTQAVQRTGSDFVRTMGMGRTVRSDPSGTQRE